MQAARFAKKKVVEVKPKRPRVATPFSPRLSPHVRSYRDQTDAKEKIRVAFFVQKAALQFTDGAGRPEYKLTDEVKRAGFSIEADELAYMVRKNDIKGLAHKGGVEEIAKKVFVSPIEFLLRR